jgi:hypothetical protein
MKTDTNGTRVAQFLTIAQVLKGLPISRRTLDRYKAQGILRAHKLNGKIVFNAADVEKFIKNRSTGGNSPAAPVLIEEGTAVQNLAKEVRRLAGEVDKLQSARIMSDKEATEYFVALGDIIPKPFDITDPRPNPRFFGKASPEVKALAQKRFDESVKEKQQQKKHRFVPDKALRDAVRRFEAAQKK